MAHFRLRAARRGSPAALALLMVLAFSASAHATTFTPTTGADGVDTDLSDSLCAADLNGDNVSDACTLRAAIQQANIDPGPDTIILPARTYKLEIAGNDDNAKLGDLDIAANGGDLTIQGADSRTTVINGQGVDRVLDIGAVVPEAPPADSAPSVTINNVTVRNGFTGGSILPFDSATTAQAQQLAAGPLGIGDDASGGGMRISDLANVALNDDQVSFNHAGSAPNGEIGLDSIADIGSGGGIANNGSLMLNRTVVHRNVAGLAGGGISNDGELTVKDSTVDQNIVSLFGGGIFTDGPMSIEKSTISGNLSGGFGGGIANLTLPSEVAGRAAGQADGDVVNTVVNSTLNDNVARLLAGGGIITAGGELDLTNDTIADDQMASESLADLLGSQIVPVFLKFGGRGAGLYAEGPTTVKNTILATNVDDGRSSDCWDMGGLGGTGVTSAGHNVISGDLTSDDEWCDDFSADKGDQIGVDPLLDNPHENGGPTATMALLPGSPALDKAADCPITDQRGGHRPPPPGSPGDACDVGAYEAYSLGDLSVAANVAGGDPSTVGDKLSYTLVVTNDGPDTIRGARLVNSLPAGVDFQSAPAGCTVSGLNVDCDLGSMAPNQVKIVRIDVRPTAPGTPTDIATIGAAGITDTNPANDSASVVSTVLPRAATPGTPLTPGEPLPALKLLVNAPRTVTVDQFLRGIRVRARCKGLPCQRIFREHVKVKTGTARIAAYNLTLARVHVGSKHSGRVRLRPCVTGTTAGSASTPNKSCMQQLEDSVARYAPFTVKVVFAGYKSDGRTAYKKRYIRVVK